MPLLSKGKPNEDASLLSQVPLFSGLSKSQLNRIAKELKEKTYEPNETIVKEGDTGATFFMIKDGSVEVRRKGKVLSKLGKGQFFGELSLLDSQPRSADVVSTEQTKCMILTSWSWWAYLSTNPKMVKEVMRVLAQRLRESNKALTE